MSQSSSGAKGHRVVIVGGGFAGLYAAKGLGDDERLAVTLVDRRNFHLFQPLLYQVATGALSPGEIAQPLRAILRGDRRTTVLLGEAMDLDPDARRVSLSDGGSIPYDTLVVATGARHSYFGHEEWLRFAPGLKTIEDAIEIRRRILIAFEAAEREGDPQRRLEWMTFAVVGGGPTGVELAGALGEIAHDTLRRDFRAIHSPDARIILIEALDRILPTYPPVLSRSAARQLGRLGAEVRTGTRVTEIDERSVTVQVGDAVERIPTRTVLWAAGVQASSFGRRVAEALGVATDRAGRIAVEPDLTVPGHPEIHVVGDLAVVARGGGPARRSLGTAPGLGSARVTSARVTSGGAASAGSPSGGQSMVPGVAPAAIQEGSYVARAIRSRVRGEPVTPFRYRDRGDVATIGRLSAVADIRWLGRFGRMTGFLAWTMWLGIHIVYLIGFANRVVVTIRWAWSFVTRGRNTRLITEGQLLPPIARAEPLESPEPPEPAESPQPAGARRDEPADAGTGDSQRDEFTG